MTPFLSDAELVDLTRVRQHAAQIRHLTRMGIPHKVRADGSPLVWRWDAQRQERAAIAQPRWSRAA